MTNLGLELLILTVSLIYFGVFMTQNFSKAEVKGWEDTLLTRLHQANSMSPKNTIEAFKLT